jgi:uncharacterized protein YbjT (DUF2867 family)
LTVRILVTGAYGFIGSAVVARLIAEGHAVTGVGRRVGAARRRLPRVDWIGLDIARARRAEDWLPHLIGMDAVVNCAGVLQDSPWDSTRALHVEGIGALFAACERAQVRRVIHISAIGIGPHSPTAFARSKFAADEALMGRDLEWVILRPSLVVGRAAYGGSALFRALATLPFIPVPAEAGELQVVQLGDVAVTVAFFLESGAFRCVLELAGPERLSFAGLIGAYRRWLGLPNAPTLRVPRWFSHLCFRLGDAVSLLGWRPPLRTTSERELARGAVGDAAAWTRLTGIKPRSLSTALAAEPASVQERWFARTYLLKPIAILGLALFWIVTGATRLVALWNSNFALITRTGAPGVYYVLDAAIAVVLGVVLFWRAGARHALIGMLMLLALRLAVAAALSPVPFSTVMEALIGMIPAALAALFVLAVLDDR